MGGAQTRQVGSATVSPGMPLLTTGVPRRRANSSVHGARRMRAASGARAIGDGVAKRHNCGARHGPGREARQGKRATQDTQDAQGGTSAHREGTRPDEWGAHAVAARQRAGRGHGRNPHDALW